MRRVIRVRPRRLFQELFRRWAQGAATHAKLDAYWRRCLAVDLLWRRRVRLLELELLSSPLLHRQQQIPCNN